MQFRKKPLVIQTYRGHSASVASELISWSDCAFWSSPYGFVQEQT